MDDSVERARMEGQKPLTKWVDEMRDVIKVITDLSEESARHRAVTESAQREYTKVCEEVARLRTETEQANGLAGAAQRERDALREEVGRLRAENDQLQLERAEAGDAAAKLLDEMKELVAEAANARGFKVAFKSSLLGDLRANFPLHPRRRSKTRLRARSLTQ